jgi:hypothetical protein
MIALSRSEGGETMKASSDHIATSHVGSLPRPDGLIAVHRAHEASEPIDNAAYQQTLREAVAEVVHRCLIRLPPDSW